MKENKIIKWLTYAIVILVVLLVISIVYEQSGNNIITQTQTVIIGENIPSNLIDINNCTKE